VLEIGAYQSESNGDQHINQNHPILICTAHNRT